MPYTLFYRFGVMHKGVKNIFAPETLTELENRIRSLTPTSTPLWGKMSIAQMLAHCSLVFEYNNGMRKAGVNPLMKFLLAGLMRKTIAGPKPYRRNSPTATYFRVTDAKEFEVEQLRLLRNAREYSLGGPGQALKIDHAWLGKMSAEEWSTAMYKHLDHHLQQFGA